MTNSCPGVNSEKAGKESACEGCPNRQNCLTGESSKTLAERLPQVVAKIKSRMKSVKKRIIVLSGKGGVGKTSISVCLSHLLSFHEKNDGSQSNVGLLDLDICGPSIPCMMNCIDHSIHSSADGWTPIMVKENLAVLSVGFLLNSVDKAVIMRGPKKDSLITTILQEVDWATDDEPLDFLIIDTPPGTGDEILTLVNLLKAADCLDYAIIVTTPQEISLSCVRKSIDFCHKVKLPIMGIVENMTEFICNHCNMSNSIFPKGNKNNGAESLARDEGTFILKVPIDARITRSLDEGNCPFSHLFEPEDFRMVKDETLLSRNDVAFQSFSQLKDLIIEKTNLE